MSDDQNLPPSEEPQGNPRGNTPNADDELAIVAEKVSDKWKVSPNISLLWITQDEYSGHVTTFTTNLEGKATAKGGRKVTTKEFKLLDKEIDANAFHIKGGLKEKYGPDLFEAHFAQFGIVKVGHSYLYPRDRASRRNALKLTLGALEVNGMASMEFGLNYWQAIYTKYGAYLDNTITTDGNVSGFVKDKNQAKAIIKKSLNCLILVLRGNYPDTWKQVLREWGFQKEKY